MDYLDEPSTILQLDNADSLLIPRGYAYGSSRGGGATSPPPRSALPPMSPMPTNRSWVSGGRSASRNSRSVGIEDTPLSSPMPMFPRRRSVTFVDEDGDRAAREERPNYHTSTLDSAVKAPRPLRYEVDENIPPPQQSGRDSPMVKSILVSKHNLSGESESRFASTAPTPKKLASRRSGSRTRLDARRQQAQLDLTFYDDSVVEDFIQKAEHNMPAATMEETLPAAGGVAEENVSIMDKSGATVVDEKKAKIARLLQELRAMDNETPNRHSSRRAPSQPLVDANVSQSAAVEVAQEIVAAKLSRRRSTKSAMIVSSEDDEQEADVAPQAKRRAAAKPKKSAQGDKKKKERIRQLIEQAMSQQRGRSKRSFVVIDLPSSAERSNDDDGAASDASSVGRPAAHQAVRSAPPARRSRTRQDSRPNLDDSDDDNDNAAMLSSPGRPLLRRSGVKRARSVAAAPPPQSTIAQQPQQSIMLPRAPVAARKPARSRAKKAVVPPPSDAVTPVRALNHTLSRFATQRQSEPQTATFVDMPTAVPNPWAAAAAPQRARTAAKAMDPNDPFSHFFETEFDTPGKFDIPAAGELTRMPRTRGGAKTGLMLATSCRSRR